MDFLERGFFNSFAAIIKPLVGEHIDHYVDFTIYWLEAGAIQMGLYTKVFDKGSSRQAITKFMKPKQVTPMNVSASGRSMCRSPFAIDYFWSIGASVMVTHSIAEPHGLKVSYPEKAQAWNASL